jgi:hypothetical protein
VLLCIQTCTVVCQPTCVAVLDAAALCKAGVVGVVFSGLYHLGTRSHQPIAQVTAQQHSTHTAAVVNSSVQEPQTEAFALKLPKLGLLLASTARHSILVRKPISWSVCPNLPRHPPCAWRFPGTHWGAEQAAAANAQQAADSAHDQHQPAEHSTPHPPITQTFPHQPLTCARTR